MRFPQNRIKFDEKPTKDVLDLLKGYGFRWDRYRKDWYAPQSIESATVIDCIRDGDLEHVGRRVGEAMMEADCGII